MCEADVVAHGAVEQGRSLWQPGDAGAPLGWCHGGDVDPVGGDPAGVGSDEAEQQLGERGLAGARRAHERRVPAALEHEVDSSYRGAGERRGRVIGERDAFEADAAHPAGGKRRRPREAGRDRRVEQGNDRLRGPDRLHAGVILRAHRAQRPEELGGEQQHREAGQEVQLAVIQAEADIDGDHGDADGGEELERQRRQERHAQDVHRGAAIVLRRAGDGVDFRAARAE